MSRSCRGRVHRRERRRARRPAEERDQKARLVGISAIIGPHMHGPEQPLTRCVIHSPVPVIFLNTTCLVGPKYQISRVRSHKRLNATRLAEWRAETPMIDRVKRKLSALRHGAYSTTRILPGEDPADFEKLRQVLKTELAPNGPLEEDIVNEIAGLVWRKQNLDVLRVAELARKRHDEITSEINDDTDEYVEQHQKKIKQEVIDTSRKELGCSYELVELGEAASFKQLLYDLDVQERLGAMIDRCLKRLLFVRGVKSLSNSASVSRQAISATTKAA